MHDDILPVCVGQGYIFRSMTHPAKSPCPPYCGWVHAIRRLKCLSNLTNPVNNDFLFLVLYIIVVNVTFQLHAHVKGWLYFFYNLGLIIWPSLSLLTLN